jgi:redox-sensitive bicupin YhaK (pirin superfamily)
MFTLRPAAERGHAQHGWLDSHHSFSFADYYDARHMGFRTLRVINEDRVEPARGFGTHGHRDMEIISYVLAGALQHKDSMGNGSVMRPGDVQLMSAGSGVMHSEFNASKEDLVHFLQIWIVPSSAGGQPGYQQQHFSEADRKNRLRLIVAPDGEAGSLTIKQDARLYAAVLDAGQHVSHTLRAGRHAWLQLVHGGVRVGELTLQAGDGLAVSDEHELGIQGTSPAELLLFDLA